MAIGKDTVWRVRVGGNDANGAGYDSTISGAGTDYTQQDFAQLALTDIACSNTTTVTSATGGFTTAMIGNAIRITGGGATSGYYFITGRTDTNTITVDRTPGTVTGGTGNVGGATATLFRLWNSSNASGDKPVPGNTVFLRGSGSDNPSTPDYTVSSGYYTGPAGDRTNGAIRVVGENGRPCIQCDGLLFWQESYNWYENIKLIVAGTNSYSQAVIAGSNIVIFNVIIDLKNYDQCGAAISGTDGALIASRITGHTSKPSSGNYPLVVGAGYPTIIIGNLLEFSRGNGINTSSGSCAIINNIIRGCKGTGISYVPSHGGIIHGNVINDCDGSGLAYTGSQPIVVTNNILSNCAVYGITMIDALAAKIRQLFADYNAFYNNTTHINGFTQGGHDVILSADPYTNAAGSDYTLNSSAGGGAACRDAGIPQTYLGASTAAYMPIGILGTPAEGSGTTVFINQTRGIQRKKRR